ncbi:MAG: OmpA family protein [Candidatus Poribacteria bacterium]|nr:OmpA family protein [Candidatus Poribacteria bacterium]
MHMQRNLAIISTLILVFFGLSIAAGESGIKNRQIFVGASARALGMGSAFTAGPPSSESFFWNPSSLGFLNGAEISLVGLPFGEEAADREGAFSLALNPQQMGIAMKNIGNISVASWFDGWGNDNEKNRMMLVGYGVSLGKELAAGASIRHHRRSHSIGTQLGWSFDLGMLFSRKLDRLGDQIVLGLTFADLGGHIWEDGELIEKMPPVTRLGATYHLDTDTIFSGDFVLHNDKQFDLQNRLRTHLGAERWLFNQRLGIRFGYTAIANYDQFTEGEWSRGFSLRSESGQLDYAYVSGNELDQGIHWISATIRWGGRATESPFKPLTIVDEPGFAPLQPAPIVMPKQIFSELSTSEAAISPNGDGVQDETVFDFDIAEKEAWQLELRDDYSEIVQTYSGTGLPVEALRWNGRDIEGNLVSDGTYTAQLIFLDADGNHQPQSKTTITVDTMPVDLEISAEPPILVSSDDTTSSDNVVVHLPTVHVRASDLNPIVDWELQFFNSAGAPIDRIRGDREPPNTIVWNKWREHQLAANPDADYRCTLTVHDFAGNRTTHEASFSLIDLGRSVQPSQPEVMAGRRDARGLVLTLSGVAFASNSYEIKPESRPTLEKAARTVAAYPEAQVIIEGHTDDIGDASYNLELSRKRASAVMTYLVNEFGVHPSRLSAIGYGEERPIAPNDTQTNRQKNRRVEIVLLTVEGTSSQHAETEVPTTPSHAAKATASTPNYTLLVSSFKSRKNAELLIESLESLNIGEEVRLSQVTVRSEPWYRVTIGQFHEKQAAVGLINEIKASQGIEPLVIVDADE